jgi:hypothetical protein
MLEYNAYLSSLTALGAFWARELKAGNPAASRMLSRWGHGATYEHLPALAPAFRPCLGEVVSPLDGRSLSSRVKAR